MYYARRSEQVVGYLVCNTNSFTVHISKVAVKPDCRRQGIARSLLQTALCKAVAERRVVQSTLHVDTRNEAAIALYRQAGYQDEAVLEDYYSSGVHAIKMLCHLDQPPCQAFLQQPLSSTVDQEAVQA